MDQKKSGMTTLRKTEGNLTEPTNYNYMPAPGGIAAGVGRTLDWY